jgi:hypothetical protein
MRSAAARSAAASAPAFGLENAHVPGVADGRDRDVRRLQDVR